MSAFEFYLDLFAFSPKTRPVTKLEERIKKFIEDEKTSESLDSAVFSKIIGSETKADFLMGNRSFVTELKTINGDPKGRLEKRIKERFAQPGAPFGYGQFSLDAALKALPDRAEQLKIINDLSGRAVRKNLQKSNEQISSTKAILGIDGASGLTILMNDSEPIIDVSNIGYSTRAAIESNEAIFSHIAYIWVSVECHRIKMTDGALGFPQLLIRRSKNRLSELKFLYSMLGAWANFNGATMHQLQHYGSWETMQPFFDGDRPTMSLY